MATVRLNIDGKRIKVREGASILEAGEANGIGIPTLCHIKGQLPTGACRICVVEVVGSKGLVGACHTPVAEGMIVRTQSPKVVEARKIIIELMLTAHAGVCVNDPDAENCLLHNLASDYEVGAPRFNVRAPRYYPAEETNRYVLRDLSKCILCRKCVKACADMAGENILSIGYRGFTSKVITGFDESLNSEVCRDCGICVEHCPTGALSASVEAKQQDREYRPVSKGAPSVLDGRAELLPLLKQEVNKKGFISKEAMFRVAEQTGLPLNEVYGVSTFYSCLPVSKTGRNVIRICKCLPCELRGARAIVDRIQEELEIGPGGVTVDGKFSLELVGCIGACDQAPAMMINGQLYGNLTPDKVAEILKSY